MTYFPSDRSGVTLSWARSADGSYERLRSPGDCANSWVRLLRAREGPHGMGGALAAVVGALEARGALREEDASFVELGGSPWARHLAHARGWTGIRMGGETWNDTGAKRVALPRNADVVELFTKYEVPWNVGALSSPNPRRW